MAGFNQAIDCIADFPISRNCNPEFKAPRPGFGIPMNTSEGVHSEIHTLVLPPPPGIDSRNQFGTTAMFNISTASLT